MAGRGENLDESARTLVQLSEQLHLLASQVGVTLGYTELLTHNSTLPEDLRELVQTAYHGADEAAQSVHRAQQLLHLLVDTSPTQLVTHPPYRRAS